MTVRPGNVGDLDAICALEAASFDDPWSREDFAAAFDSPICTFLVAEDVGEIIAYALFSVICEDAEIMSIAVDPARRRGGVGRAMLWRAIECARDAQAESVFLEVRESNEAALALYRAEGFEELRRIRGYYRRPTEDAIAMRLELAAKA